MALKIEGPIPGGNLPHCSVLRCAEEGAFRATLTFEESGDFPVERLLCTPHRDAIEAGDAWRWDSEQLVFRMGSDRVDPGALAVANFRILKRADELDTVLGSSPLHIELDTKTAAGDVGPVLELEVARELAAELGQVLTLCAGVKVADG